MLRDDVVAIIASRLGITKKLTNEVLDSLFSIIIEALESGDKVNFVGFGSFQMKEKSARTGRDLATGKSVSIPSRKVPVFIAGKRLQDLSKKL